MKKSHTALIIIFVFILGAGFLVFQKQFNKIPAVDKVLSTSPDSPKQMAVDHKASFAIFTNGTFRVFTAAMYHNLSPDVFIQTDNPNIVHVKKKGVTWYDFFKTLPFKLTKDCLTTGTGETFCTGENGTLKFYLNDIKEDDLLSKIINSRDRALITFGNESEDEVKQQLQKVPEIN